MEAVLMAFHANHYGVRTSRHVDESRISRLHQDAAYTFVRRR